MRCLEFSVQERQLEAVFGHFFLETETSQGWSYSHMAEEAGIGTYEGSVSKSASCFDTRIDEK